MDKSTVSRVVHRVAETFGFTRAGAGVEFVLINTRRLVLKKNCFSALASTLNMGLINKVDMVCLSPVGYGV